MTHNQYKFEVIRDILTLLGNLEHEKSVSIHIQRQGRFFDWQSSNGTPCGSPEMASALEKAYLKESD